MSDNDVTYDANYGGYQKWNAAEDTKYQDILNDTEMSENNPIEWILTLLGCIMGDENGSSGWVGVAIGHAADDTTTIANLQGLFSNPSAYPPDQQTQILQQTNDLYAQAASDKDASNPFYDTDQETKTELTAIMPPDWVFTNSDGSPASVGTSGSGCTDSTDTAISYFNTEWEMAANGDTTPLTATNTNFNMEDTNLTGTSQNLQSQSTYIGNELNEIEGLFKNTTQAVSGVTSTAERNEIPS